jgi:hypothetical protein
VSPPSSLASSPRPSTRGEAQRRRRLAGAGLAVAGQEGLELIVVAGADASAPGVAAAPGSGSPARQTVEVGVRRAAIGDQPPLWIRTEVLREEGLEGRRPAHEGHGAS